jgi:hypothetical protein
MNSPIFAQPPFLEALADLAALGVDLTEGPAGGVEFAVLGARTNARWWLVPLNSGLQTARALELFQPFSRSAKLAKAVARSLSHLGLARLIFRSRLHLEGVPALAGQFPGGASTCAIFTGTDGPHRKTTLQFADKDGRILGYAKMSRSPVVRDWIEAEARALDYIANLRLESALVPQKLDLRRYGAATVLFTDTRKDKHSVIPTRLCTEHLEFHRELSRKTTTLRWREFEVNQRQQFDRLSTHIDEVWRTRLTASLDVLAAATLPLSFAHGDFTPWNTFIGQTLYVFDWEYAGLQAVGHDLLHFISSTQVEKSAALLLDEMVHVLQANHTRLGPLGALHSSAAYLTAHTLLYARREVDKTSSALSWDGQERIGSLLDETLRRLENSKIG